jgi:Resolvase, N terminal domain
MRTAIYARYSSDQQSGASIDDQIRLCKERIVHEGWSLELVYRDAAISGAGTLRPGYQAMLEGVCAVGLCRFRPPPHSRHRIGKARVDLAKTCPIGFNLLPLQQHLCWFRLIGGT